ncbi:MAG: hypothetical protein ACTSRS_11385 [Candidatus Helarchaeota archaeon]
MNFIRSVDYKGLRGAGAPCNPPPQKPNSNPTKVRLILLLFTPILITITLVIFYAPFNANGTFKIHLIAAFCAGCTIALYDWIIEAYAYVKGLWFCYGGYQKIGRLDFKHVPLDMVIGFIGTGFCLAIVSYYPQLLRYWGWNFYPISDPAWDILGVCFLVVGMSLFGAFADFKSKRAGVWMNGPTWTYWKCAFYAWLPLLTIGVIVDRLIFYLWSNLVGLFLTILIVFLALGLGVLLLLRKILKKDLSSITGNSNL